MTWVRISIPVSQQDAERLNEHFDTAGALAVSFEDADDDPLFEPPPGEFPLWTKTTVTGLFPNTLDPEQLLNQLGVQFQGTKLAKIEWVHEAEWRGSISPPVGPLSIGKRTWVGTTINKPPPGRDVIIWLEPGLAFGTGQHPTTAMCLAGLEKTISPGDEMIDFGCGSGILSISAVRLGARRVWAIDHEPQALISTRSNAEKNAASEEIIPLLPDEGKHLVADLVVANILATPLIELAPRITTMVRPKGKLLLSGLLLCQCEDVLRPYQRQFRFIEKHSVENWVLLTAIRH